ncbi:Stp1/IreP family PP2C-type Ser/Thr phosphatase [Clostridiaceae bacterium]|nr:Stp1/IreP family PP2C-type Ser/Thr phosphatase [Clostridiaceae bacterium]RKI11124.1 Stp1/IreP family PP2C-type Ser/Thr phosphatase [bacterium 1XD21-70]
MQACAFTDVGRYRSMNQDYIYSSTAPLGSLDNLFLVADGMGGHNAGDYASRFAVENLVAFFGKRFPDKDVHGILKEGIRKVNQELYHKASSDPALFGMGSTLVAATVKKSVLYVANIGDSRLYLLREKLEQVTRDHSYVEELVALGKMKRGSRDYQEQKNIITRAVGTAETVDIDLFALKLKPGDYILMCSDGLSNMVDELEIEYIIRTEDGIRTKAEALVEAANRGGGRDNISVVLIRPEAAEVSL